MQFVLFFGMIKWKYFPCFPITADSATFPLSVQHLIPFNLI